MGLRSSSWPLLAAWAACSPVTLAGGPDAAPREEDSERAQALRADLVRRLEQDGLRLSPRTWDALRVVPRHRFAPGLSLERAYQDAPQPIGYGQTISQPTIVALMTDALDLSGRERVLEIGTGSGYQAAILGRLAKEVYTIEIVPPLGAAARVRLAELGHTNVSVRVGDGYLGWPEKAPFDRVLLTAAPDEIPQALVAQLAEGGILVAPVGPANEVQRLLRLRKRDGVVAKEDLGAVRFVPMVPGPKG